MQEQLVTRVVFSYRPLSRFLVWLAW